jgi:hypothetical protein
MGKSNHVTVEATKKFIKVQRLVALGVMFAGMGLMGVAMLQQWDDQVQKASLAAIGMVILFAGMAWRGILRLLHWWHHA